MCGTSNLHGDMGISKNNDTCTNLYDEVNSLNDASQTAMVITFNGPYTITSALSDTSFGLLTWSLKLVTCISTHLESSSIDATS